MNRYNENSRENGISTFTQVTLGILAATLIITTAGGILIYLKSKADERQILILTNELTRPMKEAAIQKERERIAKETARQNMIRASEEAARDKAEFKRWYKKPERCEIIKDHETRVFCANSYIRASAKWEKIKVKSQ
jgi:hypothetical protein